MIKVLFVDDEPQVLSVLERALRPQQDVWEMVFALGGSAGLAALERDHFDVVITDMRMPQVDGAAILRYAAENAPQTVRIALSGQSDMGSMLQNIRSAHIFLTKPFEIHTLTATVDRVRQLHALLEDAPLRALVGGVSALPTAPSVYTALERAILSPEVGTETVAAIVAQDSALSTKILQLVNSSFFGLPRPSTRVEHAVSYVGMTVLRTLVLSHEIAEIFGGGSAAGFSFTAHEAHVLLVANLARRITRDRTRADEAFVAGVLHDVGKVLLASRLPESFRKANRIAAERAVPVHIVEAELANGPTHAEVGAYLLGLWGIPFSITEAVANHHVPSRVTGITADDVLVAVHVADALIHEIHEGPDAGAARLDMPFLERVGAAVHLPVWREIAADQCERSKESTNAALI